MTSQPLYGEPVDIAYPFRRKEPEQDVTFRTWLEAITQKVLEQPTEDGLNAVQLRIAKEYITRAEHQKPTMQKLLHRVFFDWMVKLREIERDIAAVPLAPLSPPKRRPTRPPPTVKRKAVGITVTDTTDA